MTQHEEEGRSDALKGFYPLSLSPYLDPPINLQVPKNRHVKGRGAVPRGGRMRSTSESSPEVLSSLFLLPSTLPSSPSPEGPFESDCTEITKGLRGMSLRAIAHQDKRGRGSASVGEDPLGRLSSNIPRLTPGATPSFCIPKTPKRQRSKSPAKQTPVYASKYTNEPAPVFDTVGRLENMEQEFEKFRKQMEGTTTQNSSLKESIDLMKSKGMLNPLCCYVFTTVWFAI